MENMHSTIGRAAKAAAGVGLKEMRFQLLSLRLPRQLWGIKMSNGYFQLVGANGKYGLRMVPPADGGEAFRLGEILDYLTSKDIPCDPPTLKGVAAMGKEVILPLGDGSCPAVNEEFKLTISDDNMEATLRFYPPSSTGRRVTVEEVLKELKNYNITYGILTEQLEKHVRKGSYCTDMVVARGTAPRHGTDARIEYFFNTDIHARPTVREDGSVDFFHLNTINHCEKGDVLAKIIPEDPGEWGMNIMGVRVKPRDVKKTSLKFGNHIELSEDRLMLRSMVNGHVVLVEDKVFVSDVFEVENVDNSTGDIEFEGSVQVNGNVQSNFHIKAKGNVIISGVVEGAYIEAGGDIIIARGMNGMAKGTLNAKGNIVAKFLENVTAAAEGYISAGSILHSHIMAGTEIEVDGKRGFITGGHVCAARKITVKTLGSHMGASTVVEVGVSPLVKQQYQKLQKEINEIVKVIKNSQPILAGFTEKRAKGARVSDDQVKYVKSVAQLLEAKKNELESKNEEMKELQSMIETQNKSAVVVKDVVYPGTTIVICDVSMVVQSNYKYCRFEKVRGDVKMVPM